MRHAVCFPIVNAENALKPLLKIKEIQQQIVVDTWILITCYNNQKSDSKKQSELKGKLLESLGKIDPGDNGGGWRRRWRKEWKMAKVFKKM